MTGDFFEWMERTIELDSGRCEQMPSGYVSFVIKLFLRFFLMETQIEPRVFYNIKKR